MIGRVPDTTRQPGRARIYIYIYTSIHRNMVRPSHAKAPMCCVVCGCCGYRCRIVNVHSANKCSSGLVCACVLRLTRIATWGQGRLAKTWGTVRYEQIERVGSPLTLPHPHPEGVKGGERVGGGVGGSLPRHKCIMRAVW